VAPNTKTPDACFASGVLWSVSGNFTNDPDKQKRPLFPAGVFVSFRREIRKD
jgi:hypothetical protein